MNYWNPKRLAFTLGLVSLLALPNLSSAHDGEDHGAPPTQPIPVQVGPRASAQTDDFELLVVLQAGGLSLYLDRFASNEPVDGATLELESGAFKAQAQRVAAGVYRIASTVFDAPGRYPLTVSVETADGADLLDAMLVVPPAEVAAAPAPAASLRWVWTGAGLGLLAALGFAAQRGLSRQPKPKTGQEEAA